MIRKQVIQKINKDIKSTNNTHDILYKDWIHKIDKDLLKVRLFAKVNLLMFSNIEDIKFDIMDSVVFKIKENKK